MFCSCFATIASLLSLVFQKVAHFFCVISRIVVPVRILYRIRLILLDIVKRQNASVQLENVTTEKERT